MNNYAVFGNPIKHSQSPFIHHLFAQQSGINYTYQRICPPLNKFADILSNFFSNGGQGANITLPFKQQAYELANQLTPRASKAGAVNTLKKMSDGSWLGDNTDGIGLVSDLERLGFIKSKTNILIIGAGGAARGVIQPLLSTGSMITITNRTFSKAEQLVKEFNQEGIIHSLPLEHSGNNHFDLIINATSSGITDEVPMLPTLFINEQTCCYDMFYSKQLTPFLAYCYQHGAQRVADGIGMLVCQAAYAFELWYDRFPQYEPIIELVRKNI